METTEIGASSRRVRPWIRRLAVFVLPVLLAICGVAVWDYVEIRRLIREIDAIRAKGEPVTALALTDPKYGAGDNAEYRYSAAALLSLGPTGGSAIEMYARYAPIREWLGGAARPSSLDAFPTVTSALLSEWEEALSLVDKAVESPYRGIAPGGDYNYRVAGLWNLLRLLSARTIGLSLNGDGDAAVGSAISAIRLRRAMRPGQRFLPAAAHEVPAILSFSQPSNEALERLQAVLTNEEDPDAGTRDFAEMRARIIDEGWRRWYRVAPGAQLPSPFVQELVPSANFRPAHTHAFVHTLRAWSELLEIGRLPWPQRAALGAQALARYEKESESERWGGPLGVSLAAAVFHQAIRPDLLVYDRCSRVAVAIERYRRAHESALPATLGDLVPQYLDAVPQDPLTGQPLRYQVMPDAYMVYSVGPDHNDDGGMLLRQTPPSAAVRFTPGADMGVRVLIGRR